MNAFTLDTRGGYRKQKKLKTSQARLINALWDMHGGIKEVATMLDVPYQTPINWRNRGFVPLELVGFVSRKLMVDAEALYYEGVAGIIGSGLSMPDWEDVVIRAVPDERLQTYILRGVHPKTLSEILKDE